MTKTYFTKLDNEEMRSRLWQMTQVVTKITVWKKGQHDRFEANIILSDSKKNEITINRNLSYSPQEDLLSSFEIKGVNYFGKLKLVLSTENLSILIFDEAIYKSERRSNYRVLTSSIYKVYAIFNIEQNSESAKIISFKNKKSDSDLMKDFLNMVEPESHGIQNLKLNIFDISVTGISVEVSEIEKEYFEVGREIKNVKLIFENETITIPEMKVIYIKKMEANQIIKKHKIGFAFLNISHQLDLDLGRKINELLREIDSNKDFEDYIK